MPGLRWDRFYHVILTTDSDLLQFIEDIGLSPDVHFRETRTGFYTDGKFYSMSNTMEFLKFKPLSLLDKLRLGAGILYTSSINDWHRLEKIYVKTWLINVFGRRNYEKMWDPLLRAKLGSAKEKASAAFIWATIKRLYGTRQKSSKKEMMGCVRDGYFSILKHVKARLLESGNNILLNHGITKAIPLDDGRVRLEGNNGKPREFDRVVATTPNPEIMKILPNIFSEFYSRLETIKYLGVICVTLLLKKSLTPFYITNLTDTSLPFTGLLETSNVMPPDIIGDKALIYLPRYLPPGDPFFEKSDSQVIEVFVSALKRMFPNFSEDEILNCKVNRETHVQPLQEIRYSEKIPPIQTPLPNFYMVNTSMILNSTLNNNQVIQLAKKAADQVSKDYFAQTEK
jgi:protoporphyrinogen oxidase